MAGKVIIMVNTRAAAVCSRALSGKSLIPISAKLANNERPSEQRYQSNAAAAE